MLDVGCAANMLRCTLLATMFNLVTFCNLEYIQYNLEYSK